MKKLIASLLVVVPFFLPFPRSEADSKREVEFHLVAFKTDSAIAMAEIASLGARLKDRESKNFCIETKGLEKGHMAFANFCKSQTQLDEKTSGQLKQDYLSMRDAMKAIRKNLGLE